MRKYSAFEKEIIRGLISIYNEKRTVSIRDLFNPMEFSSRFPSLNNTGKWAIVIKDELSEKLAVCIPNERCTKENNSEIKTITSFSTYIIISISNLIKDLTGEGLIVSSPIDNAGKNIEPWVGSFKPTGCPPLEILDHLQSDMKQKFIEILYQSIDYISESLIDYVRNDFQSEDSIITKETAVATKRLVWFTLIGPIVAALITISASFLCGSLVDTPFPCALPVAIVSAIFLIIIILIIKIKK